MPHPLPQAMKLKDSEETAEENERHWASLVNNDNDKGRGGGQKPADQGRNDPYQFIRSENDHGEEQKPSLSLSLSR